MLGHGQTNHSSYKASGVWIVIFLFTTGPPISLFRSFFSNVNDQASFSLVFARLTWSPIPLSFNLTTRRSFIQLLST
ncbi:hypothetical protein PILCRDRAFT_391203 [Piloderma croceum F 1598]|uniref:Uncharacterized protein n=1 Tax=Piloderma croceum (strain F 1598) TaxID=765440 RepID=A0A0C3FYA9_PILCF|nr:hypothetical protein PILCRDRAFT_391203 [Piloderma croceum F 1598]